jgi:hypothetical protein
MIHVANDTDGGLHQAMTILSRGLERLGVGTDSPDMTLGPASGGMISVMRVRRGLDGETRGIVHLHTVGGRGERLDDEARATLDRQMHRHARRLLRLEALRKADEDADTPPQWSYTMHRLMASALRARDIDPTFAAGGWRAMGGTVLRHLCDERNISIGDITVEDGRIDMSTMMMGDMMVIGRGRPAVVLERVLPETMIAQFAGRMLHEVVDHPAVVRAGPLRIRDVVADRGSTTLVLDDVQDFLRRPPVGTDRRWRRVPFKPHSKD